MRRLISVLALATISCSPGPGPRGAEAPPRTEAANDPPAPTTDEAETEQSGATEDTVAVLRFAEGTTPRIDNLPTRVAEVPDSDRRTAEQAEPGDMHRYYANVAGPTTYPVVEWPEHADALNAQLLAATREVMGEVDDEIQSYRGRLQCRAVARPPLLVLHCAGVLMVDRGGPTGVAVTHHYRVDGAELTPVDLRDSLLPEVDLETPVRRRCQRGLREGQDPFACEMGTQTRISAAPGGLRVDIGPDYSNYDANLVTVHLPYASLSGVILADSPLGEALRGESEIARVPRPAVPRRGAGVAVSDPARLPALMHRWAELPEADRAVIRLRVDERDANRGRLVLTEALPDARARALAASLGARAPEPVTWSAPPARILWTRTRRDANVRRAPSDNATMQLPRGTWTLALDGQVGLSRSALGERGSWAYISPAPGLDGRLAGNLIEPVDGCRPSPEPLLAGLPERAREGARRTLVMSRVSALVGSRRTDALLATALDRPGPRASVTTAVLLHRYDPETCAVGRRIARIRADGALWTARPVRSAATGGEGLLALVTRAPRGTLRMALHRIARGAPRVWGGQHQLHGVERFEVRMPDGGYAIARLEGYRETLVLEPTDAGYQLRTLPDE